MVAILRGVFEVARAISKYVVGHKNIGRSVWLNPISNKELLTRGTWIVNVNARTKLSTV